MAWRRAVYLRAGVHVDGLCGRVNMCPCVCVRAIGPPVEPQPQSRPSFSHVSPSCEQEQPITPRETQLCQGQARWWSFHACSACGCCSSRWASSRSRSHVALTEHAADRMHVLFAGKKLETSSAITNHDGSSLMPFSLQHRLPNGIKHLPTRNRFKTSQIQNPFWVWFKTINK